MHFFRNLCPYHLSTIRIKRIDSTILSKCNAGLFCYRCLESKFTSRERKIHKFSLANGITYDTLFLFSNSCIRFHLKLINFVM